MSESEETVKFALTPEEVDDLDALYEVAFRKLTPNDGVHQGHVAALRDGAAVVAGQEERHSSK